MATRLGPSIEGQRIRFLGWPTVKEPKRPPDEHFTHVFNTCSGAAAVKSAIDDLEELYQAIEVNGKLGDTEFDFMKSELTVKARSKIRLILQRKFKLNPLLLHQNPACTCTDVLGHTHVCVYTYVYVMMIRLSRVQLDHDRWHLNLVEFKCTASRDSMHIRSTRSKRLEQ